MVVFIAKVLFSAIVISFASWLSIKKPVLAGFIIALPLLSILSIAFSYAEHKNLDKTILFAKSIVIGIPASLTFFLPFFFAKTLGLNFITTYTLALFLLIIGFVAHKFIMNYF
ncbi:MAG: hypothetical protein CMP38_02995 [Rickettsiales bacterium]|nr:hypothetical protein [Rickettsiales bacterium]|tara:strand:+ start:2811 stop:3149 length:339 start_codon:yes stop_codon:yes gene_type:complete